MIWIKRLNAYGMGNWIIILLFALSFLSMIAQVVGLGVFLPIFEYIFENDPAQAESTSQNLLVQYVNLIINSIGIELSLLSLLAVAFSFYFASQLSLFFINYANAYFQGMMLKSIQADFFKFYLRADSKYYDQVKIGDFINISSTEVNHAVIGVIAPIRLMVASLSAIGSIAVLMMLSYELTAYIIFIILAMLPYPLYLIKQTTKVGRNNTKANSRTVSFLLDRLRSPRLVRLSGTSEPEIKEYSGIIENKRTLNLKTHYLKEMIGLIFEPSIVFSSLIILYIAITYLNMPPSSVVLFMIITIRLVPILRTILVQKQNINKSKGSIESIDSLILKMEMNMNEHDFPRSSEDSFKNRKAINKIELKNVYYQYSDDKIDALSDASLIFERSTINAIIGPSGSGKSTLIDVISTYRTPNSGKVLFDGLIFNDTQLNNVISYVPQQPQIFDGDIVGHISYGFKGKSIADIKIASKLSGAHNFISKLDNGYQTILNNNGDNLSGGERYRLDMARALLSDAPILILDEPTSALDYDNKARFINTINKIKADTHKIVIVITHDFSIMHIFDSIVMMKQGKVFSQSTHEELLGLSSWYKNGIKSEVKEVKHD